MSSTPSSDRQVWTLRLCLLSALTAVVIVAVSFNTLANEPIAAAHGTTTTTTTTVPTKGKPNPFPWPPTGPSSPITAAGTDLVAPNGCNFAIDNVAVAVKGSKKKQVPKLPTKALGHCRILMIGDSVGDDIAGGLGDEIDGTKDLAYFNVAKSDTGLSNEWYYNWPQHLATFLRDYKPELLIVCLGGNDEQNFVQDGHEEVFGTASWRVAYGDRVKTIINEGRKAGALVLWVGMPIMQPYAYRLGIETLNKVYVETAEQIKGTTYLPIWSVLASPSLQYIGSARVNGHWEQLRSADGIHLYPWGALVVGTYVTKEIAAIYHVTLKPREAAVIDR